MSRRLVLAPVLCVALSALVAPAGGQPAAPRVDASGDPLPEGVRARLGSLRWRASDPVLFLAFLPDGKGVLSIDRGFTAQVWDPASGKELRRFDVGGPPKKGG